MPAPATVGAENVLALDMFSASNGVAVVGSGPPPTCEQCLGPATGPYYFAVTSNGGKDWATRTRLPGGVDDQFYRQMRLAFASGSEGYLAYSVKGSQAQRMLFTSDGGMTFAAVTPPAPTAGILSLLGGDLWMEANVCPAGVDDGPACRTELFIYPLGALKPTATTTIPIDIPLTELRGPEAPVVLDRIDATSAVASEGGEGQQAALQVTHDSGATWQPLADPCGDLPPGGLAVTNPGTWKLYCALDGGMNQGHVQLYTTTNSGGTWQLTSEGAPEGPDLGRMGPGLSYDLTASGNGQVLWLVGNTAGLSVSTDSGADWNDTTVSTGGDQPIIATAGATDAWVATRAGLYHTSDGTNWSQL